MLLGTDMTQRAFEHAKLTLHAFLLHYLTSKDADNLLYPDHCLELFYSFDVLHYSPDIQKAIQEVFHNFNCGVPRFM
jgi:hypothetical protein